MDNDTYLESSSERIEYLTLKLQNCKALSKEYSHLVSKLKIKAQELEAEIANENSENEYLFYYNSPLKSEISHFEDIIADTEKKIGAYEEIQYGYTDDWGATYDVEDFY